MFVFSMRITKKRILAFSLAFAVMAVTSVFIYGHTSKCVTTSANKQYSIDASDNAKRIEFLSGYGWEVSSEPVEICDIKIPTVFNSVYENYNQIQKNQGLDLKKYMGKTCKRFSYEITNYPDHTEPVKANILVLGDKIIAGDISSVELNGFMHGFSKS